MKIPTLQGIIDRRILVNFTADPDIIRKITPNPFQPKIYNGKAIVGVCLIRFKQIRPKGLPGFIGVSSENAAHRIAVEWKANGALQEGVFILRRDSSSYLNTLAGGRIFPGKHFRAKFDTEEEKGRYHIAFKSSDGITFSLDCYKINELAANSIFQTLENASGFFESGSVGYSKNRSKFEGLKLKTYNWNVQPLYVTSVYSSFFHNNNIFPKDSIRFDNALLMTQLKHEWLSLNDMSHCL